MRDAVRAAVALLQEADSLIVLAGAGMGVDSGLPDFRGTAGFWRAYPHLQMRGLRFEEIARPAWFRTAPRLAWGFYGHRLHLYRQTPPHEGFAILRSWMRRYKKGGYVITTNVDGQFQRAGFDPARIVEVHGSIHRLQCLKGTGIWSAEEIEVPVSSEGEAQSLPPCRFCEGIARPNILMFGDASWDSSRADAQKNAFEQWRAEIVRPALVELGAGTALATARTMGERLAERYDVPLIRINPHEADGPSVIPLLLGAKDALTAIENQLGGVEEN
jgi:NAD-dependent SIR2 family protein deacetylase